MRSTTPPSPPITVLVRVRGGRWREIGSAVDYFGALAVAEAAPPGSMVWFRTNPAAEVAEDLSRAS